MKSFKHLLLIQVFIFLIFHLTFFIKGIMFSIYLFQFTILFSVLWLSINLISQLIFNKFILQIETKEQLEYSKCGFIKYIIKYRVFIFINFIFFTYLLVFSFLAGHQIYFHDMNSIMQFLNISNYI